MVALNLQTADGTTALNRALFDLNGGCGYVLKGSSDRACGVRLAVRVLSVHNLPKSRDERCQPSHFDLYHPELSSTFVNPPLSPSDVASPLVEVV